MSQLIRDLLADRNIHPSDTELAGLAARWQGLQRQRGSLEGIALGEADIALRTIPGGDHLEH